MSQMQNRDFLALAREVKALGPHIHPPVPNPAPLGLFAFGLTTALAMVKHAELLGGDQKGADLYLTGFALFFGGLLQVIAGLGEIKRNNIFGYTAFLLYGGFWMSLSTVELVTFIAVGEPPSQPKGTQALFFLVGVFSFVLWICTLKMNKTICLLFGFLTVLLFTLMGGVRNETANQVAGYLGLITAAIAFWLGGVELINDVVGEGKELIPLGHWTENQFKFTGSFHVPSRIHGVTHTTVLQDSQYGPHDTASPTLTTWEEKVPFEGEEKVEKVTTEMSDAV